MPISVPADLLSALQDAQTLLCVSHVNADGDAYGSLLGFTYLLRQLGKSVTPVMPDPLAPEFAFLPGAEEIVPPTAIHSRFDLAVSLDLSSPDRMGSAAALIDGARLPLAVIDHHATNTHFGQFHWVDARCAATSQMIVALADAFQVPLDRPLAECLLTGIVTDTLCFRTSNTTPAVLEAAMRLQQAGADLAQIVQQTLHRLPFRTLQLWALVLPHLQLREGVVWATVSQQQLHTVGLQSADLRLSNVLSSVNEAVISAIFTEKQSPNGDPMVECSFRARPGYDVGKVAFQLGGGGHVPASGCTLAGTPDDVVARVLPLLFAASRQPAPQHTP